MSTATTEQTPATPAVATPPATPPEQKAPETKATLEHFSPTEIEKRVQDNLDRWLNGKPPLPEDKPEDKPKEDAPEKAEEPEKVEKPKVEKKPKAEDKPEDEEEDRPRRRRKPVETPDDGIEKAVNKLADKLGKRQEKEAPEVKLSTKDAEKIRVFEQMAKENSDYAGLAEKFKKFASQEERYKSKWEKDNPGDKFDPEDDAHAEFYDKHSPEYDQDDYVDARIELRSNEKLESFTKKQREESERQRVEAESARQAERMTADIPKALAKEVVGKDVDFDALEEEDPVAHGFISKAIGDANDLVAEMASLSANPSRFDKGNKTHQIILERLEHYEGELTELPYKQTVIKEGGKVKEFATLDDFRKMDASEQRHYWTVYTHPDQTKKYILRDIGELVKADIDKNEKLFQARLSKRGGQQSQTEKVEQTTRTQPKRESPDLGGGDRRVTPLEANKPKVDDDASRLEKWLGGI